MPPPTDTIRLLHVDDDPAFADVVSEFLELENERVSVVTATDASEGLDLLADDDFDCIVSDYDMPGQNGIEFLETVREDRPDFPFILYTGKGSEEVAAEAISAGVTDYLQKRSGTDQYTNLANRVVNAVERYRIERDADRTRTQLEAISENSADAILIVDPENEVRFANPSVEDLFGYAPEELQGEPLTTIMPDRFHDAHLSAVDRYLETGERTLNWSNVGFTGRRKDGTEFPVSVSFSEFEQNGDHRFIGIIRDISERSRIEAQLREREQRFRNVAENIEEVVWISDPDKEEIIYVNSEYEDLWGRSVDSLYEDPTGFLDAVHPDDYERVQAAVEAQADGGYDEEYRIVRPDGAVRWVWDRGIPVANDAGEVERIVGVAADITDRKRSEQRLREERDPVEQLTKALPDIFYLIDPDGTLRRWNDRLLAVTGYSEADVAGMQAIEFFAEEDRERVVEAIEEARSTGQAVVEADVVTADGERIPYEFTGRSLDTLDVNITGLVGIGRDISERRAYERRLERQNERLDRFASIVSHDLRNPLEVANAGVELASEECESIHLDEIDEALDRMEALIADLLTLARAQLDIDSRDTIDLANVVFDCWTNVETAAATLSVETDRRITADGSRLQQLFENLVRNAVEHGGSDVSIEVGDLPDGFYFQDDGPGIPTDARDEVFEPGYSTAETGTGFGLSIVAEVVDAHDWDLRVTESPDGGARFEITDVELRD